MSTFIQEDEIGGKGYDARLMRRLLGYLRPYRPMVILAVMLLLSRAPKLVAAEPVSDYSTIDSYVQSQVDANHFPGVALAVVEGGSLLHAQGFGHVVIAAAGFAKLFPRPQIAAQGIHIDLGDLEPVGQPQSRGQRVDRVVGIAP